MPLTSGSKLGAYEILDTLGSGGMGEVYRARDPRLGRDVAVKVLPESFADDRDRLARFRREAHVLASLNHPRIAAIHGLEEVEGTPFLVLELVAGEDLAALLARGPLPLEEALDVARQIAEGLEGAHEAGVVHRDLKPANVKLTPGGAVKLLDFGLAKALVGESGPASDVSHSPTLTAPATGLGVLLGTAAYMAPEQARGKAVDRRADIWAFGVVLYEMLTGARLFAGETVTDVLAAVLTKDVDLGRLPARTPPRVRELVRRCLIRDPRQRLQDAGDARLELEQALRELAAGPAPGEPPVAPRRGRSWMVAAGIAAALLAGFGIGRARAPRAETPTFRGPLRAVIPLPEGVRLAGWASPVIALSDDGRTLAFVGEKPGTPRQLFVHDLAKGETRLVPSSESAEGPFFSPDGQSVAFATGVSEIRVAAGSQLMRFSLGTGLTEPLTALDDYFGGCWSRDGSIYLVNQQPNGIFRLRPGARSVENVAATFRSGGRERKRQVFWPQVLPDGRSLLVVDIRGLGADGRASVLDLPSRQLDDLGIETGFARYTPSGHLLTVRKDGTLMAVAFDPKTRKARGAPSAVLGGIAFSGNDAAVLAVSDAGTLAYATGYLSGSARELVRVVRIPQGGAPQALSVEPQELARRFALSPDGERAAIPAWDGSLWVWDLARGTRHPLAGATAVESVAFSPDGRTIVYAGPSGDEGSSYEVHLVPADGSAPPRALPPLSTGGEEMRVGTFTPDGRTLVGTLFGRELTVWAWAASGATPPTPVPIPESSPQDPALSPDGRLLAYASSVSGRSEIYARTWGGQAVATVSSSGGTAPRWSRDGSELYFRQGDVLMAASVTPAAGVDPPRVGVPEKVADLPDVLAYAPAPKRREFVALQHVPGSGSVHEIRVVVGFFDELRRLTAAARD